MSNQIHPTLFRMKVRTALHDSKAETSHGIRQFLLTHKCPPSLVINETAEEYKLHKLLDRAKIATKLVIPHKFIEGYKGAAVFDDMIADQAKDMVHRKYPRKRNLYRGMPRVYGEAIQENWSKIEYKGHFKGWTGSEVSADYQSAIFVTKSGRSAVHISGCIVRRRLLAPSGMKWDRDHNGAFLKRLSDGMDYHPNVSDLNARAFATRVRKAMAVNWSKRLADKRAQQQTKRLAAIYERQTRNTFVTLDDSRRAGNCVEGTLRFAERKLHLTREEVMAGRSLVQVPAPLLRKVANGNGEQVEAAIRQAWMRETTIAI